MEKRKFYPVRNERVICSNMFVKFKTTEAHLKELKKLNPGVEFRILKTIDSKHKGE